MSTQPIQTLQSKHFVVILSYTLAITLFAAVGIRAQQMRAGISVNMAETNNALPMPAADQADAWIVTVPRDGRVFFGTTLIAPEGLANEIKHNYRSDRMMYIKADSRAPYTAIEKVITMAHAAGTGSVILLTAQPDRQKNWQVPKGLEVRLALTAGVSPAVIHVVASAEGSATVRINGQPVDWNTLQRSLADLPLPNEKTALVNADGRLSFAQLARVIDLCTAAGFRVVLATNNLNSKSAPCHAERRTRS